MFAGVFGFTIFLFWVFTIVDVTLTDKSKIRRYNKPVWFLILALGMVLGSISWYLVGRPKKSSSSPAPKSATSPGADPLNAESLDAEPSDAPETKSNNAPGLKLPSRQDLFGVNPDLPRGPDDDDAWLASLSSTPASDAPVIDEQPGDTLDPEEAVDFAAWEEDFGIFDPEQDPEQTDQDSGSNA